MILTPWVITVIMACDGIQLGPFLYVATQLSFLLNGIQIIDINRRQISRYETCNDRITIETLSFDCTSPFPDCFSVEAAAACANLSLVLANGTCISPQEVRSCGYLEG